MKSQKIWLWPNNSCCVCLFLLIASCLGFASRTDWTATRGQACLIPSLLSGIEARCGVLGDSSGSKI